MAQQIESKGFPLCSWLSQAITSSAAPLNIMVKSTYVMSDPVESTELLVDPAGTETYEVRSDSFSQASCDMAGYSTDPDYGTEISAHIAVSIQTQPDGFTAPSRDEGEEYKGRVILDKSVLLDPVLRLEVSEIIGNGPTNYTPFFQTVVDFWDSGAWAQPAEGEESELSDAAPPLSWANTVELCNRLDTATLAEMFALSSPDELNLEAEGYTRETTPGGVKCTFSPGSIADRVEVVFDRWNSAEEVSSYVANIAANACSQTGNLVFYQYGGSCDTSTNMEAYGFADTVGVVIRSYFWRDYVSDEATYKQYVTGLYTSAETIILELADHEN